MKPFVKTTTVRGRLQPAELIEDADCIVAESGGKWLELSDLVPEDERLGEWTIVATFTPDESRCEWCDGECRIGIPVLASHRRSEER